MKFRDYVSLYEAKLTPEMDELALYIDNDYQLYKSQFIPILKNYTKKMMKGVYDRKMAAKGFMHLLDRGARQYVKEFGSPGDKVQTMFPKKDREKLALSYAMQFEEAYKNQEYDFMKEETEDDKYLSKKQQKKLPKKVKDGIINHKKKKGKVSEAKGFKKGDKVKYAGKVYHPDRTGTVTGVAKDGKVIVTGLLKGSLARTFAANDLEKVNEATLSEAHRPLYEIARDIKRDWKKVNFAAKPYLDAMGQLDKITDMYMFDSAVSVVLYFLSNATTWRGPTAKKIKVELKAMAKGKAI